MTPTPVTLACPTGPNGDGGVISLVDVDGRVIQSRECQRTQTPTPTPTATVTPTTTVTTTPTQTVTVTPTSILTPSRTATPSPTATKTATPAATATPPTITPTPTTSPTPNTIAPVALPIFQLPSDGTSYYISFSASSATEADAAYLFPTVGFVTLSGSGFSAQKFVVANLTCTFVPAPGVGRGWDICLRKLLGGVNVCSSLGFSIYNTTTNATDNVHTDTVGVVATMDLQFTPINTPAIVTKGSCGFEVRYVPAFSP